MNLKQIAHIESPLKTKFGVPRQASLAGNLVSRIVFEPEFRNMDALRGLEGFSHIWLIWEFSEVTKKEGPDASFRPTVRPPRLGGNEAMGVFATRSPFRPNPLGLSCVELGKIKEDPVLGPVITVRGADLMDGTPIYDIKPYIRYADSRPEAVCGYVDSLPERTVEVVFPDELAALLSPEEVSELTSILRNDPRPSYQDDPDRVYGMLYRSRDVRFRVSGTTLTVVSV